MNDNPATLQKWVDTWERAHIALNAIKSIEMSKENYIVDSLTSLTELFNHSLATAKPTTTSGLVEMQKYFAKLRKQDILNKPTPKNQTPPKASERSPL